jgi:formamidase
MRIAYDLTRRLADQQPRVGHNRWHPDLTPIARVAPGEAITLECADGTDAQVTRASKHHDVATLVGGLTHPLTGPVAVEGAEPGDVLEVEIVEIEPDSWGFTLIIPGFGFLNDVFTDPYLVIWELDGERARTDVLPGVAVPAAKHPGIVGLAPSRAMLDEFRRREAELAGRGGAVAPDDPETAFPPEFADGLRTIPPRELGGNIDVHQLGPGSTVLLPVAVPGGLFSVGDVHFVQGDGEVCGTAVEMAAAVTVRFHLRKQPAWRPPAPAFITPPRPERGYFGVTGLPVVDGRNESFDLTLAARNALLAMIDWLVSTRGYAREAAYVLCSAAAELRLSEVVDGPNPLVSALMPLDVFEDGAT